MALGLWVYGIENDRYVWLYKEMYRAIPYLCHVSLSLSCLEFLVMSAPFDDFAHFVLDRHVPFVKYEASRGCELTVLQIFEIGISSLMEGLVPVKVKIGD